MKDTQTESPHGFCDQPTVRRRLEDLNARIQYKADCFDYLCWLEERQQKERVPGSLMLVIASDGTTCWGNTYEEAVKVAMHHDKGIQDAAEARPPNDQDLPQGGAKEAHE